MHESSTYFYYIHSTSALCSSVCGGVVKYEMPCRIRYDLNFKICPLSKHSDTIDKLKNFSTINLNSGKFKETSDLFFKEYN